MADYNQRLRDRGLLATAVGESPSNLPPEVHEILDQVIDAHDDALEAFLKDFKGAAEEWMSKNARLFCTMVQAFNQKLKDNERLTDEVDSSQRSDATNITTVRSLHVEYQLVGNRGL